MKKFNWIFTTTVSRVADSALSIATKAGPESSICAFNLMECAKKLTLNKSERNLTID